VLLQVLGVGGFNSWRYDQPSLYFFDVATNPAQPKFIKSVTPEKGAVADDLIRLPNGGFLVSLMGNKQGKKICSWHQRCCMPNCLLGFSVAHHCYITSPAKNFIFVGACHDHAQGLTSRHDHLSSN
jgi:hypothetical protein